MNDLSSVNSVPPPGDNSISQASIVVGLEAPAILFHGISFGRWSEENTLVLGLLSSATFWAMFGLTLATISRLRRLSASL